MPVAIGTERPVNVCAILDFFSGVEFDIIQGLGTVLQVY